MLSKLMNMIPITTLPSLDEIVAELPCTKDTQHCIANHRRNIEKIIHAQDDRLLVIIGPCSIHDPEAAWEYAQRLQPLAQKFQHELLIVMRTYFEKPRTTIGWKGFLNDPRLDNSYQFNDGIQQARSLLIKINRLGLACGAEILNTELSNYYLELLSWASIGARTTESQPHREFASALPCPVGFKNTTDGNVQTAVNAIRCAKNSHILHHKDHLGQMQTFKTTGNDNAHLILRGGKRPNYHSIDRNNASSLLREHQLANKLIIDCSHGNSQGNYKNQRLVANEISRSLACNSTNIAGVMIESFLVSGKQPVAPLNELTYGQSITDACIDIDESTEVLAQLADAVNKKRLLSEFNRPQKIGINA